MKALKERILRDGRCFPGGILKVDNFINHQMDPILMKSIGVEFVRRFASTDINKIITVEASGIAPAIMVGYLLELPVVFAKKKKPSTMEHMLVTSVYSFTKQRNYDICVSRDFLCPGDRVLFIDDFLANGNAAKGIIEWAWASSSRKLSSTAATSFVRKASTWSRWPSLRVWTIVK